MSHGAFTMDELMDSVELKNRIEDAPVVIVRDAKEIRIAPGQSVRLPRKVAEFLRHKSLFRFNPGDYQLGIPPKWDYKLAIVGDPHDDTPLTREEVLAQKELLDVKNMPELSRTAPDGTVLRRVYIDPRSTGAMGQSDGLAREEKGVVRKVTSGIVREAAEQIADAAVRTGVSEAEIGAAVAELTGKGE